MPKNYLTKNFSSFLKENSAFGFLNKPIKSGNTNYIYYYKIKNYPFYILTGYDIQFANQQFLILVLPRLLEFLGLSLIFLGLLYLFYILFIIPVKQLSFNAQLLLNSNLNKTRKIKINAKEIWYLHKVLLQVKRHITQQIRTSNKIKQINKELIYKKNSLEQSQKELETAINIIVQSNQAKERFIRQVNKDLYTPILTIAQHATHLYQQLKTTQLFKLINTSIEKIYTSSLELKAYSSSSINLEEVNIKNILEEALLINQKTIFDKKIHLQSNIDERLPCLLADDLKLKQACTALIYRSINTTPFQGELYVYCSLSQLKQKHIEIKIFDTGFGLDEAHLESINKKFQKITGWDGLELKLETIKNIIEAHQGEIIINNQIGFGSYTTIFLPYIHKTKINSRNNIYYLNKK